MVNRKTQVYLFGIIAIAVLLLPLQDWASLLALPREHYFGVLALTGLGVLSEMLSIRATVGAAQVPTSIAFIPYFAAVLLFPGAAAVAVTLATCFATQLLIHKKPLLKSAFNSAQAAIAMMVAVQVYESIGGLHTTELKLDQMGLLVLVRLGALGVTFFFLNQVFVGFAIALSTGNRFINIFARIIAPTGANFLYDVLVSPIAVVVAVLYSSFDTGGLIIGVLPLLIIRHSIHSTVKLQQANKDLLAVLVKTIETRDPYTSGHSIRVSMLARAIAEDMNLSTTLVDRIETAALVHDIGKVDNLYASIIRKEGSLTELERKVIVTHAAKGAEFLRTLSSFKDDIIEGVQHHHERYDGTGYPDNLFGESIPLAARIIMLCDSIDAMLSDRPYRKALSIETARAELLRCAGTQFDPRIVDIILTKNTLERAAALVRPERQTRVMAVATA